MVASWRQQTLYQLWGFQRTYSLLSVWPTEWQNPHLKRSDAHEELDSRCPHFPNSGGACFPLIHCYLMEPVMLGGCFPLVLVA